MSIKKCVNGSFVNDVYREYGTDTDTITTLPKTIIGDGQNISAWSMKGNMTQSGTPTPSNPVYPTECGDKTANLFDDTNVINIPNLGDRYGVELPSGTYSIYNDTDNNVYYGTNDWTGRQLACSPHSTATIQLNVGSGVGGFFIALNSASQGGCTIVSGSTPPDHFIPFGYEIPILSNGTTYPIYLSEPIRKIGDSVDTAPSSGTASRVIKELVLTGDETLDYHVQPPLFMINIPTNHFIPQVTALCTEYVYNPVQSSILANSQHGDFGLQYVSVRDEYNVWFNNSTFATNNDFKAYLAQQYANGTPVTVWYILATAQTESFTVPTIPTTGTAESFDVDTTLKPSEVSLTYHGWHEHEDTKYTTP